MAPAWCLHCAAGESAAQHKSAQCWWWWWCCTIGQIRTSWIYTTTTTTTTAISAVVGDQRPRLAALSLRLQEVLFDLKCLLIYCTPELEE